MRYSAYCFVLALHLPLLVHCTPTVIPRSTLPPTQVRANAINISTHSWEIGTLAEALTEYEWPTLGVFACGSIPPPGKLREGQAADVLSIAEKVVAEKTAGSLPLINGDGAVGDPASIGVSVLLRNWTLRNHEDTSFADAASQQLDYLLHVAPRAPNGAISHRESQVQLWADFISMGPPFIAYYGALEGGTDGDALLQVAYDQVRLYRDVLFDSSVGLWRHIDLGEGTDPTHWGTGNAWAAAGALRVLATIQSSSAAESMESQQDNLEQWVQQTLDGVWRFQQPNGGLLNYLDQPDSFLDTSSTALLAASTFRFASITGNDTHIPAATLALQLIRNSIDDQGWLQHTVDPLTFSKTSKPGKYSPEGQSFVLLLEAAVSAWQA
ncbi:Six-hairpin glycosidase [Multifurca ochricompacta]|uniref:Six-hairpin glycosidase n=1 Tax=Multifurca ochricompacta TaxID=376703 RepID=A0AAD4M2H5_9AGAM|nr:Six-hairpin glycosidase [Multifurca ochricompacta]